MGNKILVAYATKYGATADIVEKIGETLRQNGQQVDVLPVEDVADLKPYGAVVLGSAVYAGQWRKEAVVFLREFEHVLAEKPVWLFSSGPTGEGDAVELMKGWRFPKALQPIADRIQPCDIVVFHGDLNVKKMNWGEILLVKGIQAPIGDYRDWEVISVWANSIAESLKEKHL